MPSQVAQYEHTSPAPSAGLASKNDPTPHKEPAHPLSIARPPSTSLPPAYVALAAASQLALENHRIRQQDLNDDDDTRPLSADHQTVRFSHDALALINTLLDQLLYSFLAAARSTTLSALRPAIAQSLKGNLARRATASADLELKELLAGSEDEDELEIQHATHKAAAPCNIDLVWKRTRLRLMIYTRLGEMEDDEEERHLQHEQLGGQIGQDPSYSEGAALVTWTAAIYLTSILEFIAERSIVIASEAAFDQCYMERRGFQKSRALASGESVENVIVENYHVERLALDPIVGRTWRMYRQNLRPTPECLNHNITPAVVGDPNVSLHQDGLQAQTPSTIKSDCHIPNPPNMSSAAASTLPSIAGSGGLGIDETIISDSQSCSIAPFKPTGTYLNYRPAPTPDFKSGSPPRSTSVKDPRTQSHVVHETSATNGHTSSQQRGTFSAFQMDGTSDIRTYSSVVGAAQPLVSEDIASNDHHANAIHLTIRPSPQHSSANMQSSNSSSSGTKYTSNNGALPIDSYATKLVSSSAVHSTVASAPPSTQVTMRPAEQLATGREVKKMIDSLIYHIR